MWKDKIIQFLKASAQTGSFNRVMDKVKIVELEKGRIAVEMQLTEEHCNVRNQLHGGMSATLVDSISTLALRTYFVADNLTPPDSASVELSLSFLSSVPKGNHIRMEAETVKVGRKMAFLIANIYDNDNKGRLVVTGKHTKFLL